MAAMYARKLDQYQPQEVQRKEVQVQVPKKQWITKGEKVIYSFFTVVAVIASVFVVSFSSSLDSINRDIQNLETKVEEQKLSNDTLKAEVKSLSEPSRIIEVAKANGLSIKNSQVEQANLVR
jgi:cell division protein FtsL